MLPEDVSSTHNFAVDYAVMLGVGGLAWIAALLGWLWAGARSLASQPASDPPLQTNSPATGDPKLRFYIAAACGLAIFLVQFIVERAMMYDLTVGLWVLCLLAFAGVLTWWTGRADDAGSRWALRAGCVAAAVVALVHGQIEMTFFQPASAPMLWLLVGLCPPEGAPAPGSERKTVLKPLALLPIAGLLIVLAASVALATTQKPQGEVAQLRVQLWQQNQGDAADVERLLTLRPASIEDYFRAGLWYEQHGDNAAAAQAYRKAVALSDGLWPDPAKVLTDAQRREMLAQIEQLSPRSRMKKSTDESD